MKLGDRTARGSPIREPAARKQKRLLTVGHSYVLRASRRLPEAIAAASNGEWDVTVAAPTFYAGNPKYGDLRPERLDVHPDESVKVVGIPVAFTKRVHFALYGLELQRLMATGFDAIHCWEEPFILSGAQMAFWAPPKSILTFFTWQNIKKSYPPPFNFLENRSIARCDGWIGGGVLSEEALKDRTMYRDRPYRIIGPGVDPDQFCPKPQAGARVRAELGWDSEIPVVGYVGRFTAPKGLPILMRALTQIRAPWRALFVGSGALDEDVRRWAQPYGARVKIVASVANERIPDYLNALDLLCVPSQTTPNWREQFGRILIEAFACGVCVVASDSGEIPHVVADAGRIIGEADEDRWRMQLEALLVDPTRRRELAARGRVRVHEHYTWPAIGTKYVEFFEYLDHARRKAAAMGR